MIYVVLGMHKSGTTLVSRLLHESGVEMGDFDYADGTYESGHTYERASVRRLNDKLLDSAGKYSIHIRPKPLSHCDIEIHTEVDDVIAELESGAGDVGFKDPRTSLTYATWKRYLPEHRIVAVYRAPEHSWPRYRSRRNVFKWPFDAWFFLESWCIHNALIVQALESSDRDFLVFEYYSLLENDTDFVALEAFVGRPLVDERLKRFRTRRKTVYPVLVFVSAIRRLLGRVSARDVLYRLDRLHAVSLPSNTDPMHRDEISETERPGGLQQ